MRTPGAGFNGVQERKKPSFTSRWHSAVATDAHFPHLQCEAIRRLDPHYSQHAHPKASEHRLWRPCTLLLLSPPSSSIHTHVLTHSHHALVRYLCHRTLARTFSVRLDAVLIASALASHPHSATLFKAPPPLPPFIPPPPPPPHTHTHTKHPHTPA